VGQYAYSHHAEEDYWLDWEEALKRKIDRTLINHLYEETIWADSNAAPVITDIFRVAAGGYCLQQHKLLVSTAGQPSRVTNVSTGLCASSRMRQVLQKAMSRWVEAACLPRQAGRVLYIDDRLITWPWRTSWAWPRSITKRGIRDLAAR